MKLSTVPTSPKSVHRTMLVAFIGGIAILLALVGVGWYYILEKADNVNKYNAEIYIVKEETEELSSLSWRYQRYIPKKSVVLETIPETKSDSTFMADMEALAAKNGITITKSTVGGAQKSIKTGDFSQAIQVGDHYELSIRYEVTGLYGNFTKFINELNTLRRLSSINDVAVTANLTDKSAPGKVNAIFVVTIYAKK